MTNPTPITSFGKLMAEELSPAQIDAISGGGERVTIDGGIFGPQTGTCPIASQTVQTSQGPATIVAFRDL